MNASKNHTISKFVAKAALRVVIVLMALPVFMYFTKKRKYAPAYRLSEQNSTPSTTASPRPIYRSVDSNASEQI